VPATTSASADATLVELLLDPVGRRDPYPRYRRLREEAPVLRTAFGPVVLSRYEDCQAALRDPRLGRGNRGVGLMGQATGQVSEARQRMADTQSLTMLFANPPEHTRLRRLVSREFTPGRVDALRPAVEVMVHAILDRMADEAEVDVMKVLAFPLPVTVIGELLGIPEADRAGFQPLVQRAVVSLEINATDEQLDDAQLAALDMSVYFLDLLAERRARPTGDLLSALATAADADDRLTEEEVIATAILLFAAGFETTTNLIGNGLWALLSNPDQLERLRADTGLVGSTVEEILRFDSPVQVNGRSALVEAEIAGEPLAKEDFVICLQGAANRDPDRFPDPERFDIGRDQGPPLSFGSGIHHCLGAGLARMEGQVVFKALVERFATIDALVDEPEQRTGLTLRGLAALPVRVAG
jgi:cytochrome P450